MGSSCIVKNCPSKRKSPRPSFHRLTYRLHNLGYNLEVLFGVGNIREVTKWSRICSEHLEKLRQYNETSLEGSQSDFVNSNVPASDESDNESLQPIFEMSSEFSNENERLGSLIDKQKAAAQFWISVLKNINILRTPVSDEDNMIADAVRSSCSNSAMTSASESKLSPALEGREEEEGGIEPLPGMAQNDTKSPPAPINGEVNHHHPGYAEGQDPSPSAVLKQELDALPAPPLSLVKDEDHEVHASSEDEDKLVINEGGEKKEQLRPEGELSCLASPGEAKSPSLKRAIDDADPADAPAKRTRLAQEEDDDEDLTSGTHLDDSLAMLNRDLKGLELLLAQKEAEWNGLLRLTKKKEELYMKLARKKQVLKMGVVAEEGDDDEALALLPQGAYASLGTSQFPLMMMKQMLSDNYLPQVLTSHGAGKGLLPKDPPNGPLSSSQGNISVIDIHTPNAKPQGPGGERPQISISPDSHSKLGKQLGSMLSMKPILPKPSNNTGGFHHNSGHNFPPITYGPQGPTVSVHHLIAAHRKDNPNIPPIRGAKRGAWRQRYEGEKRSSSREPDRPSSVSSSNSETDVRVNASKGGLVTGGNMAGSNNNNNTLAMNDPSVSYKDVLLQFAQLTQAEKQPGSPQISIIPVTTGDSNSRKLEPIPDSTSVSRELPVSSQSSHLSQSMEGSSALAKLLLESGASNHSNSKNPAVDLSPYNSSPHCLTLSALLSGGTTTTLKDKPSSATSQMDSRSKKNPAEENGPNPKCQGCHKHRAQFVCAGCGNQWYCSRSCQVTAWEKHSEKCSN